MAARAFNATGPTNNSADQVPQIERRVTVMSRLAYPDPAHVAEAMQEFPAPLRHVRVGQTVSHAPTLVAPYYNTSAAVLQELELDPKLRQLAILRVAERARAPRWCAPAAGEGELVDGRDWVRTAAVFPHASFCIARAIVAGRSGHGESPGRAHAGSNRPPAPGRGHLPRQAGAQDRVHIRAAVRRPAAERSNGGLSARTT
jgi:hypothetical protein